MSLDLTMNAALDIPVGGGSILHANFLWISISYCFVSIFLRRYLGSLDENDESYGQQFRRWRRRHLANIASEGHIEIVIDEDEDDPLLRRRSHQAHIDSEAGGSSRGDDHDAGMRRSHQAHIESEAGGRNEESGRGDDHEAGMRSSHQAHIESEAGGRNEESSRGDDHDERMRRRHQADTESGVGGRNEESSRGDDHDEGALILSDENLRIQNRSHVSAEGLRKRNLQSILNPPPQVNWLHNLNQVHVPDEALSRKNKYSLLNGLKNLVQVRSDEGVRVMNWLQNRVRWDEGARVNWLQKWVRSDEGARVNMLQNWVRSDEGLREMSIRDWVRLFLEGFKEEAQRGSEEESEEEESPLSI